MRNLNFDEAKEIMALKPDDITLKKLVELFAATSKGEARFQTNDRFILTPGKYTNKQIETTVGRYILNMFALPEAYIKKHGYVNEPMTSGNLNNLEKTMLDMILNKEMDVAEYIKYIRKGEWLSGATVSYTAPSFDLDVAINIPEVMLMKKNLNIEYADKIKEGDQHTLSMISNKLVSKAKEIMLKNPEKYKTIEWTKAGVYSIENNYRKSNVSTGLQRRPSDENEYLYVDSNYAEGLSKKDFAKNSNMAIIGGLSRGLDSADAGYSGKKILGAMSTWSIDKDVEDCGTSFSLDITIPKSYSTFFYNRWINDGGKLVKLTSNNINKYVDKPIMLRSPMFCKSENVCKTCAGDFLEEIGIEYEGLAAFEIADVLVNNQMKAFHDSSIRTKNINPFDYIKKIE